MNKFPVDDQSDLVLTASVNWSSDAAQIIDNAEREFNGINQDGIEQDDMLLTKSMVSVKSGNGLNESWGHYFAKKSPPMGDLCGSHGVDHSERPEFTKQKQSGLGVITEHREEKLEEELPLSPIPKVEENEMKDPHDHHDLLDHHHDDEDMRDTMTPDDMVMINLDSVHKSTETLNLNDLNDLEIDYDSLTNRDSNSTQKTRGSTDSQRSNKMIHVPRLKHIQRFYQFKIREHTEEGVIEGLMTSFIETFYGENDRVSANVAAISYKRETLEYTVLVVFDEMTQSRQSQDGNGEEWMDHFLSFEPIQEILDRSMDPHFTQLSAS